MSSEVWFLIYALAVFRLAELISKDLIFESFRRWVGRRAAAGRVLKFIADLIFCPLCIGMWLSFPAALLFGYFILGWISVTDVVTIWLGMSGLQYLLSSLFLEKN